MTRRRLGLLIVALSIAAAAGASVPSSLLIGLLAGALVVGSVLFFERVKIDDPVGAISVHLVCGAFGTVAVGLFAQDQFSPNTTGNGLFYGGGVQLLLVQLAGVVAVGALVAAASALAWGALRVLVGIRVPAEEEHAGLDVGEHGISGYPEFHVSAGGSMPAAPALGAARVGVRAVERAR